jgi:hypothetical protein
LNLARAITCTALLCIPAAANSADAAAAGSAPAMALVARSTALKEQLASNAFHRPLYLQSSETEGSVRGEALGLIRQPFAAAGALTMATHWCDVLTLHLNTKSCRLSVGPRGTVLHLAVGRKSEQPVAEAHAVDFAYTVAASSADYLHVILDAPAGPLGTREYRISLEAAPAPEDQTIIRLTYSYSYGVVAKLALQAYLASAGRDKVGFTVLGKEPGGSTSYIAGTRALAERNTMRYYLAIEAFLGALSAPAHARTEKSMDEWFAAAERFPRQLHEMDRQEYMAMKRREYARQRAP